MVSKLIKINLERYIPFYIVSFIIMGWPFLINALSTNFFDFIHIYEGQIGYRDAASSLFYVPLIPLAIILLVIPFIAQSYRFSLSSVDTYYQAPFKRNHVKYINSLCLLIPTLISFTVIFFTGMLIIYLKSNFDPFPKTYNPEYLIIERVEFNFGYYALGYLAVLLTFPSIFFFSSFVVGKTNRMFNAVALEIMVFFAAALFMVQAYFFIALFDYDVTGYLGISIFGNLYELCGISPLFPVIFLSNLFEQLIRDGTSEVNLFGILDYQNVIMTLQLIFLGLFTAYTVFDFFYYKEPSGEYAGKPEGHSFAQMFLFHASFGIFAITGGLLASEVVTALLMFVFMFTIYYLAMSLIKRSFRIRLIDLYLVLGNVSLYVLSILVAKITIG